MAFQRTGACLGDRRSPVRLLTAFLLLAGCGGGSTAPQDVPGPPIEPLPVLTSMTLVLPADSLAAGESITVTVAALDHKARPMTVGSVAWTSSNPQVARIGSDGVLLCLTPGTTTISASVGPVTGQRVLRVTPRPPGPVDVASVVVAPVIVSLDIGSAQQLTATLKDFAGANIIGREVTWSTSNEAIAIVSADGVVTARSTGTAIITASSGAQRGGAEIAVRFPVDTSILVTVARPIPGIVLGDTITVVATVHASFPIDSVILSIGGIRRALTRGPIGALGNGEGWTALVNVTALQFGPNSIVVTAFDVRGARGVTVVPFSHDPRVNGGGLKPPSANK